MPRFQHGTVVTESALIQAREDALASMSALTLAAVQAPSLHRFDYLFPSLQDDPDSRLRETEPKATVEALRPVALTIQPLS